MKHFRLIVCSLLLILVWCVAATAQDDLSVPTVPPPNVHPFDTFGKLSWEDEQARLDNFAVALLNTPDRIGQIIIYAGRKSCAGAAQVRAMRMKRYLVKQRDIEWNRVIWRDAGHLEKPYVVLWLSQKDYLLPLPISRSETLAAKDAQLINCKTKKQRLKKR